MERNDDAKKFREEQKIDMSKIKNVQLADSRKRSNSREQQNTERTAYTAKRGTAHRANENKKKGTMSRLKLASIILAASIGIGTFAVVGHMTKTENTAENTQAIQTIEELEEAGVDINNLGLGEDTIELFEKYDKFFENYDSNSTSDLSDDEVVKMAEEIEDLNFYAIKDNVADLLGVTRDDVTLKYQKEEDDTWASVIINKGDSSEEIYRYDPGVLLGVGKSEEIPEELGNLIFQIGDYEDIIDDVKNDSITKKNAVEKLQELYDNIFETVGTKDMELDENGNIILVDYTEKTQEKTQGDIEER